MFHLRSLTALIVCAAFANAACGETGEKNPPSSLSKFFKPGMLLEVVPKEGGLAVDVYVNELVAIRTDAEKLDVDGLVNKHQEVKKQVAEEIEQYRARMIDERGFGLTSTPKITVDIPAGARLYQVKHVGLDYLLLDPKAANVDTLILNLGSVSTVRLLNGLNLAVASP